MKEALAKLDADLLFADGYDDCILGITIRNGVPVVLYSSSRIIQSLSKDMTEEEAAEYFEFNINGAYVGERTPMYVETLDYNDDA